MLVVEHINSVIVGANPRASLAVDKGACHAAVANQVAVAHLYSGISESHILDWLHKHSLLQHAKPQVAGIVFYKTIHLGAG